MARTAPMAVPTTNRPRPCAVSNSVGTRSASGGNAWWPKNSANNNVASRSQNINSNISTRPRYAICMGEAVRTNTILQASTGSPAANRRLAS